MRVTEHMDDFSRQDREELVLLDEALRAGTRTKSPLRAERETARGRTLLTVILRRGRCVEGGKTPDSYFHS